MSVVLEDIEDIGFCLLLLQKSLHMYLLVLLMLLSRTKIAESTVVCDGVIFHGKYHDKQLLFGGIGKAYNLVLHKSSGNLFFSHIVKNGTNVDFGVKACHLESKNCREVPGLAGGYAIGIDTRYDDIYLGGHNGLYKYNFRTKYADFFAERNKSIWVIMIERYFYFVEYPSQKLYVYDLGLFKILPSTMHMEIDKFFISKRQKIYFTNSTGLFKVNAFHAPVLLKSRFQVRQFAENMFGDVYFATSDGIYIELTTTKKLEKVADINQVYGIIFMKMFPPLRDELIFSDRNGIYRLQKSKYNKLCLAVLEDERKLNLKNNKINNSIET